MANLDQMVLTWAGIPGGVGNTVFYCTAGQASALALNSHQMFDTIKQYLPAGVAISWPGGGDTLDEVTGKANAAYVISPPATVTGTGVGNWSAVAGCIIRWNTGQWANGRQVHGRTFLVPLATGAFGAGGIQPTVANAIQAAAQNFIGLGSNTFKVWHRPIYDHSVKPPVLSRPGLGYTVTAAAVPTKGVYMKRRRDT